MSSRVPIAIGFGSNLGDRADFIASALDNLRVLLPDLRASSLYETPPMYVADQPAFLNGAAIGMTDLDPLSLIRLLKGIEQAVGRTPRQRNGPREIDLDLISYGSVRLRSPGPPPLQVPHPLVAERRFVLEPLFELDPDFVLPGLGSVAELFGSPGIRAQPSTRYAGAAVPV